MGGGVSQDCEISSGLDGTGGPRVEASARRTDRGARVRAWGT